MTFAQTQIGILVAAVIGMTGAIFLPSPFNWLVVVSQIIVQVMVVLSFIRSVR
jgi:hypothetical protein